MIDDDDDDDNNNNNKERKPSLLLREDGTAKIVTINDDDKDDASKHPKSFPSPPKTPLPSYLSLLPKNKTIVSAKQRNVFRDTVAYAITLSRSSLERLTVTTSVSTPRCRI